MKIKVIFFAVLALVQLAIPMYMIYGREQVISEGVEYKFKTRPVDPYDVFRGKYIQLDYEVSTYKTKDDFKRGEVIYVAIGTDSLGYAQVETVSKWEEDMNRSSYVKAEVQYCYNDKLEIKLPFERYYMEESKALDAEIAHRDAVRDTTSITYGLVHVKDGDAVLTDVIINDVSIKDYVELETL